MIPRAAGVHPTGQRSRFGRGGSPARLALTKGFEAVYFRDKGDPGLAVPLEESPRHYRRRLRRAVRATLVPMGWSAFYRGDVVRARIYLQELEAEVPAIEASPSSWALGLRAWVEWAEGNLPNLVAAFGRCAGER